MSVADRTPRWCYDEGRACQRWRCTATATWNVWSGYYCDRDAVRAGWLPGAIQRQAQLGSWS